MWCKCLDFISDPLKIIVTVLGVIERCVVTGSDVIMHINDARTFYRTDERMDKRVDLLEWVSTLKPPARGGDEAQSKRSR